MARAKQAMRTTYGSLSLGNRLSCPALMVSDPQFSTTAPSISRTTSRTTHRRPVPGRTMHDRRSPSLQERMAAIRFTMMPFVSETLLLSSPNKR